MIVSTLMLGLGGAFVASRFTIPRCAGFAMADDAEQAYEEAPRMTPRERKGVLWAGVSALVFMLAVAALTVPAGAPLRNQTTGGLVPSPFLRGLVPLLFFLFALPGYVYGKITGSIEKPDDVLRFMEKGMKDLAGYIVLMLVIAQFINLFSWSRLDTILAINGAEFLQATGLTGPLMFILFMILVALINIFMGSGSAKWAIFAPIFIPMLAQLNYSPAFIQLMYRVGDSITNCVSPLYVYFPLLMGWVRQHDRSMGIGTILSLLIPYAVLLFFLWVILVFVWFWFDLPIGVGEGIFLRS
jgi:aminobenzoyl-glutamate transport protein